MGRNQKQPADIQQIIDNAVAQAVGAYAEAAEEKMRAAVDEAMKRGAEFGAKAAIRAVERERTKIQQQQYDWKYHNTKLLIRNYRRLNEYFKNAVFELEEAEEIDDGFEEIMRLMQNRSTTEDLFVDSIKRNYLYTRIIMTHVNKMLDVYRIMCERSQRADDARHWRVLEALYIADDYTTAEKIAREEHIDKRTVYKDIDVCIADLTALMFGVSGIEGA